MNVFEQDVLDVVTKMLLKERALGRPCVLTPTMLVNEVLFQYKGKYEGGFFDSLDDAFGNDLEDILADTLEELGSRVERNWAVAELTEQYNTITLSKYIIGLEVYYIIYDTSEARLGTDTVTQWWKENVQDKEPM